MGTTGPHRAGQHAPSAGDPAEENEDVEQLIDTRVNEVRRQVLRGEYVVDPDAVAAAIVQRLALRGALGSSLVPCDRAGGASPRRRPSRAPQSSCS